MKNSTLTLFLFICFVSFSQSDVTFKSVSMEKGYWDDRFVSFVFVPKVQSTAKFIFCNGIITTDAIDLQTNYKIVKSNRENNLYNAQLETLDKEGSSCDIVIETTIKGIKTITFVYQDVCYRYTVKID